MATVGDIASNPFGYALGALNTVANGVDDVGTALANSPLNTGSTVQTTPTYTVGVNDPATLASYDLGISNTNSAINNLPGQLNSGNSAIDASYTNALNQLLLSKNQANAAYDTSKTQSGQDYVTAKNTIGANAGNTLNGLQRLLGSRGAGGGSAFNIVAPGAVAQQATQQRGDAGNTFGENNQSLDTNWNNYLTGYNNQVTGATAQRDQEKTAEQQTIDNNRATLLQSLAALTGEKAAATGGNGATAAQPYLDEANGILGSLGNTTTAPINYTTSAYTAPTLSSYTTNPTAAPTYNGSAANTGADYVSPALTALLGKKQVTS